MNLSFLLAPLAGLFGAVVKFRGKLFDWDVLPVRSYLLPVIGVGNLAVGGTGKTPFVEHILRLLHEQGWQVAMLSRGYGRHSRGFVMATPASTAEDIGDEPFQVKQNCPFATVAVCANRAEGINRLLTAAPCVDVIVLDDAFQHRYVKAGFNILLTDAHRLYIHDRLLPWGRLREPASSAGRARAVVVTKCGPGERPPLDVEPWQSLFYSRIVYASPLPQGACAKLWQGKDGESPFDGQKVLVIAAIANPQPLVKHLQASGAEVTLAEFRDHHDFTARDARRLADLWQQMPGQWAVTTQKDIERLRKIFPLLPSPLTERLWVQPITVDVVPGNEHTSNFNQIIIDYVRANQRDS